MLIRFKNALMLQAEMSPGQASSFQERGFLEKDSATKGYTLSQHYYPVLTLQIFPSIIDVISETLSEQYVARLNYVIENLLYLFKNLDESI